MNIDRKIVWRFVKVGQEPRVECNWRMVVTITLADGGESKEDLAAAADRLLSGFSFDHRFVFRKEEATR
jgi:hypothetical protein